MANAIEALIVADGSGKRANIEAATEQMERVLRCAPTARNRAARMRGIAFD